MKKLIALTVLTLATVQYGFSQCPDIILQINSTNVDPTIEVVNGENITYFDICQGDDIEFEAFATYEDGSLVSTPATYTWNNNGGNTQIGQTVTYNFANSGGYEVGLDVQDADGCENDQMAKVLVRISTTPIIELTAEPIEICLGANSEVEAIVETTPTPWSIDYNNTFAEELFVPDGPSCPPGAYETSINFNSFLPNQTLTNINDFLRVCIDMEHSWMGDIMINLHAPNGNTVVLLEDQNGAGTGNGMGGIDLGIPSNDDSFFNDCDEDENPAGTGFTYCWSPNPTTSNWHTLDNTGNLQNPVQESNPATNTNIFSDYNNSFNNIVNTPLNGTWTVEVIDTWGGDNGWIFQWWIDFADDILPSAWSFTPTIESGEWVSSTSTVSVNGDLMTVNPTIPGANIYNYAVTDNFGCTYTESVEIEAVMGPEDFISSSVPDNCTQNIGSVTIEGVGGLPPYTYNWPTINQNNATATNLGSGTYPFIITDANGCILEDIAFVDQVGEEIELEVLETTDDACELGIGTMLVTPLNGVAPYTYNWVSSNSTTSLGTNLETGIQGVTVTDLEGCQGQITYEIGNIPPPTPEFSFLLDECTNDLILSNETDDALYYQWQIGDLAMTFEENPIVHLQYGEVYPITLTATHEYCSDSLTQVIDLSLVDIYSRIKFPNVFTPNDDYTNDLYKIIGLKECDAGVLRIFNRWGEEVYYTVYPYEEHWDGKKLGQNVNEGAYFYVLKLKYGQLKGTFNLFR